MTRLQVGVVGYGDFTRVMLEALAPYADVIVSSRSRDEGGAGFGARFAPVHEVLGRDIIVPSIPAQYFRTFFEQHKRVVNPAALVIDVASVKVRPLQVLEEVLPASCEILGTHPMFGPASIAKNGGMKGLKTVVCPVRVSNEQFIKMTSFFADELGLQVIHKTPEQHDRDMAYVQGLSHYIGRVMDRMNIPESELSTLAYDDLMDMKRIQGSDSWDLFRSIMQENPYAAEVHEQFLAACRTLDATLLGEL